MACSSEYFPIGSVVWCKTHQKREYEGSVEAFDPGTRMLILKCPSSNCKQNFHDVQMINLSLVTDVIVKNEATSPPPPITKINFSRVGKRVRTAVEEKERIVNAALTGVSAQGQKCYLAISKTIEELSWVNDSIVVMNQVKVNPPYKPEDCVSLQSHSQAEQLLTHIRKIIEKHLKDQALQEPANKPPEPEPTSPASPISPDSSIEPDNTTNKK